MAKKAMFCSVILGLVWGAAALGDVVYVPADHSTIQAAPNLPPEGRSEASEAPLGEWEQLAEVSMNSRAVTTWYVDDDSCPGSGSGTEADPFCLIQDCIDAAMDGEKCVVAPGTYFENINFLGKAITLRSSNGPDVTTIDAGGSGSVVICETNEGPGTVIDGFTITGGNAFKGGGMFISDSSPTVTNCTFDGNLAPRGGGLYVYASSPMIRQCSFVGNTAAVGGGAYFWHSDSEVTDCQFRENHAGGAGGLYLKLCNMSVRNSLFAENSVDSRGAAMFLCGGNNELQGNTIGQNVSPDAGATIWVACTPVFSLLNTIMWDNQAFAEITGTGNITITHCDIEGGREAIDVPLVTWLDGNIDADPLFIDPANGDFRLSADSPCIDAGDNTAVPEGIVTDLDGNPRFVDDPNTDDTGFGDPPIVDMGAYEVQDPCADDDNDGRVTICHVPPGKPDDAHTITVSVNAVPAHLAHGDYCGPCEADLSAHAGTGTKIDGKR